MTLACLGAAPALSAFENLGRSRSTVELFLGLLTLLNAPFDWASLGLTRALLRRGLELGGWWPYLLALVDAALAGVIIALLALTLVIGVQAFDELAVHGGGKSCPAVGRSLRRHRQKSGGAGILVGLCALALVHDPEPHKSRDQRHGLHARNSSGWRGFSCNGFPRARAVPEYKRQLAAIGLDRSRCSRAPVLGIAAQAFLAWGLIFHVMPWIGLDLLDMARAVAAFDVPLRAYQLFAGIL